MQAARMVLIECSLATWLAPPASTSASAEIALCFMAVVVLHTCVPYIVLCVCDAFMSPVAVASEIIARERLICGAIRRVKAPLSAERD